MPQAPVATLILNRNFPQVTDRLVAHLQKWNQGLTDIYVIESGSDKAKLSQHCSFWANWPEAMAHGLRWARGFNYGLIELERMGKHYDYYFLVMGDSIFDEQPTIAPMLKIMTDYSKIGIVSPLSPHWGENHHFTNATVRCFYLFPHVSWLFRGSLLTKLRSNNPTIMNYLYDGTNFRGYYDDIEALVRTYQSDFAAAITNQVTFREAEEITLNHAAAMKTDAQAVHRRLMMDEGLQWMKHKYGFAGKGDFKRWAIEEYKAFLRRNSEYQPLSVLTFAR